MAHVHSIRPRIALQLPAALGFLALGCTPMIVPLTLQTPSDSDDGASDDL
jgi:hypothetical protein